MNIIEGSAYYLKSRLFLNILVNNIYIYKYLHIADI